MKPLRTTDARFAPPFWLTLMLALGIAGALLVAFIDALHQNVRQGEEIRRWQRVGAVRHTVGAVGNTAARSQTQQLGASMSTNLPR